MEDVDAYLNAGMMGYNVTEEEKTIFPLLLYEYVSRIDPQGTKKKTVIISNKDEGNPLAINTEKFEKRKRAGEYYISLNVATKAEEIINKLAYKIVEDLLKETGLIKAIEDKKVELDKIASIDKSAKQKELEKVWNDKTKSSNELLGNTKAKEKASDYSNMFVNEVKSYIIEGVIGDNQTRKVAEEVYMHLADKDIGGSSPGSALYSNYLKTVVKGSKKEAIAVNKICSVINKKYDTFLKDIKAKIIAI